MSSIETDDIRVMEAGENLVDAIGNTPLIRIDSSSGRSDHVQILGKAEFYNPGGSVKDRAALAMILDGEASGALVPGRTILDSTSGNTGIAYAMIAAARGYRVTLCLPANANQERKRMLRIFGAELVLTDPAEGSDGAIRVARRLSAEAPDRYFYPDQYNNPANWLAHYRTTAPEIWTQTEGRITHFVAALGTTGTFVGTGRRLKEFDPSITLVSVEPDGPFHGLEGMKHLDSAIVPGIFDHELPDVRLQVSTEDAYESARQLARTRGLFVGISSGAAVAASRRIAASLDRAVIVTVLCDGGTRYLSERFWTDGDERWD